MYHVYLLQSRLDKSIYIGYTTDLKSRLKFHNAGYEKYTKHKIPWDLVYFESYKDRSWAVKREHNLKDYGKALAQLKKRIGLWELKGAGRSERLSGDCLPKT